MKVLFLDIDGVINTVGAELGFKYCLNKTRDKLKRLDSQADFFDPACLYYLREIVVKTGCRIVVSSTWRQGAELNEMKSWFKCTEIADAIIDKTPVFYSTTHPHLVDGRGRVQRGEEIRDWLKRHPEVTHYAVLDDDSDMDVVYENYFQTDSYDGLKRKTCYQVINHLNSKNVLKHYRMDVALAEFLDELATCYGTYPAFEVNKTAIINLTKQLADQYNSK